MEDGKKMVDIIRDPTNCTNCGIGAAGMIAILSLFGLRNMGDNTRRVQAWCRKCRIEERKVARFG